MKRYLLLLTIITFVGCGTSVFGQQAAQYSLYMFNKYNFNAAYGGLDNSLSATAVFRKQWLGFDGSPITQNINVHLPWYYASGAVGLNVENDILGAERNTSVTLSYNFIGRVGENSNFSIGVAGGLIQKMLDGTRLRAPDGEYEGNLIDHNDDFIPETRQSAIAPALHVGAYYKSELFEVGFSVANLLEPSASYALGSVTKIDFSRTFYLSFGYNLLLGEKLVIHPSLFVKSDLVQTQADFSALVRYNGNIFGGVSFRGYSKNTVDALVFMAGMGITEKITLAYAYDMSLSGLSGFNSGSHEIMLNYNLKKKIGGSVPSKIIFNPRFY
ncbi:MAG: PorP/SprF family type IX secretion system membrane protein [Bacteroidota bacterium]